MAMTDKELGLFANITRRDFLNGTALAAGGAIAARLPGSADAAASSPYPPALTGMRGHHDGSFETMHAIRDGSLKIEDAEDTREAYDLVVVGAGISGLAAAHLYRKQAGRKTRILILDNHDDFGGHAKRNEFKASNGKLLLGYGGSQSLQTPSYFSPAMNALLRDIGVETKRFEKYYDSKWFEKRKLNEAVFFTKDAFGTDKLVAKADKAAEWVPQAPLNDKAKADLVELIDAPKDYFAGLSREQKLEKMSGLTYLDFLKDEVKADPQLIPYFQRSTHEYFGIGIDGVTCADAWGNGNPGFDGMDLGDKAYRTMSPSGRLAKTDPDDYIYHFPDGNASIARLLVRSLVPGVLTGRTMEDIVLAACDYGKLDTPSSRVKIRLNATAARIKHMGEPGKAKSVEVVYVKDGKARRVTAGHAILACFNQVIPYIAPEVSEAQGTALKDQQKIPLLYTNVQIRNWQAFSKLGVSGFEAPGHYWDKAVMDFPVSMGGYQFADTPEDPVVLHVGKVPNDPGNGSLREQALAGRAWVQTQTFEEMERELRDLLARALGSGGFDPAKDIEAITVNRWSHGYAYEYMRPWDIYWPDGPLPIETARKGWGRIAIANADAGAYAYAHSAVDQAARAVRELLGVEKHAPFIADFPGPPRNKLGLA
jgi:spermidine dehydrogenase